MPTPNEFTVLIRKESTSESDHRGVVLDPNPLEGMAEVVHKELESYAEGDVIQAKVRIDGSHIRWEFIGVVSSEEKPKEEYTGDDWIKVSTEYLSPDDYALFNWAQKSLNEDGEPFIILITGPSGEGKTHCAQAWAEEQDMDHILVSCALVDSPLAWFFMREVRATPKGGTETVLIPTPLTRAIRKGNAVIVLDDSTRVDPMFANPLLNLLDFNKTVTAHGEEVAVGDNVLFVFTANEGPAFTGTFRMDAALKRRVVACLKKQVPPPAIREKILIEKQHVTDEQASEIIRVMEALRQMETLDSATFITTGNALNVARLVRLGASIRRAFQLAIINLAPDDMLKPLQDAVNSELGVL